MEHKAKIVFSEEAWKIIKWFTYNFDTEIGALGIVKLKQDDGEKYFYVEELLFPKQKVSGATVHFTPEMWGELLKERGLKGLQNVAFYWHKHPGFSSHSETDDEHTFETFMSKEANRKHFLFLQTAIGSNGWNQEARIDIRLPIRHTILNADIEIRIESSEEEERISKKCNEIAEKCIIKEETTYKKPNNHLSLNSNFWKQKGNNDKGSWKNFESCLKSNRRGLEIAIEEGKYGNIEGTDHLDNDILDGYGTKVEEKVSIDFEHGQATIVCGKRFGDILQLVLNKKSEGKLINYVREWKHEKTNTEGLIKYNLQPKSGKYLEMKMCLTKGYLVFCEGVSKEIEKEVSKNSTSSEKRAIKQLFKGKINESNKRLDSTEEDINIIGKQNVKEALDLLEAECIVDWSSIYQATVYDFNYNNMLGYLWKNDEDTKLVIKGSGIIWVLKTLEEEE